MRFFPAAARRIIGSLALLLAVCHGGNGWRQASAAFLVEAHESGLAWENFELGGDTFTVSSSIPSNAVGTTATNSIFGGDGVDFPDTYIFSYTPGRDTDNVEFAAGTVLGAKDESPGNGYLATGFAGGVSGRYNVYITSPASVNVSGVPTIATLTQEGDPVVIEIDQNNEMSGPNTQSTPGQAFVGGMNNAWFLLGSVDYIAGNTYSVTLEASINTFVSQRVHGILWEYTPVSEQRGDFNGDGVLNAEDIDALTFAIRDSLVTPLFDLNSDGDVDLSDRDIWVDEVRKTYFGDSNLDGEFNSSDFVLVFQAGEYEDATALNSTWATGDWNGDGDFDSSDFVKAFTAGGFELGPRAATLATHAVPEPTGLVLGGLGAAMLVRVPCRRRMARWI